MVLGECLRGETECLGEGERRDDLRCLSIERERLGGERELFLGEIDLCLPRGDKDMLLDLRLPLFFGLKLRLKSLSFSSSALKFVLFKAEPTGSPKDLELPASPSVILFFSSSESFASFSRFFWISCAILSSSAFFCCISASFSSRNC